MLTKEQIEEHDRIVAEVEAEHARFLAFAESCMTGTHLRRDSVTGKISMRQWTFANSGRKVILSKFSHDAHTDGAWRVVYVREYTSPQSERVIEREERAKTKRAALLDIGEYLLKGAA